MQSVEKLLLADVVDSAQSSLTFAHSQNAVQLVFETALLCHQGDGKGGLSGAETGSRATAHSPTAPRSTPRPDGSSPDSLVHQESGMGGEGQVGGPLQELMSSMKAGQLGHKMNDSDIHDQLVHLLWHTQLVSTSQV